MRVAIYALTAGWMLIAAGCAVRTGPVGTRGTAGEPSPIHWPMRWTEDLPAIVEALPKQYVLRDADESRTYESVMREVIRAEVRGKGIVQITRSPSETVTTVREGDTVREISRRPRSIETGDDLFIQFMSWSQRPDDDWIDDDDASRGFWRKASSHLSLAMPPEDTPVQGIAVTLGPHTTISWRLRYRLPERGWAVVHIGMTSPHSKQKRPELTFEHDADVADSAAVIAEAIDEDVAEYAYAAQAVVEFVRDYIPQLSDAPVAVVGFSRGALIAPAVAARLGEADALVLLLGGANLLRIAQSTSFKDHRLLTLQWQGADGMPRRLSRAERVALAEAYLEASQLDPFHMAQHLHRCPTLLVTAAFDRIVPASSGNLLHERLGRPERWNYLAGHMATGWLLDRDPDRVINWMNAAVQK